MHNFFLLVIISEATKLISLIRLDVTDYIESSVYTITNRTRLDYIKCNTICGVYCHADRGAQGVRRCIGYLPASLVSEFPFSGRPALQSAG